jgi:Ca2+-binding RTX toxin-like protein
MNTNIPSHPDKDRTAIHGRTACAVLLAAAFALVAPASRAEAAVTAAVAGNVLTVTGDAAANIIQIRVVAGDPSRLEVFVDNTTVIGSFPRATFTEILVRGGDGNDQIGTNDTNGEVTERMSLFGEGGVDFLDGGTNDDLLVGGDGDDRFYWRRKPGDDGNDVFEGGNGNDQFTFQGTDEDEVISLAPEAGRIKIRRDIGNVTLDLASAEVLLIHSEGGNDVIDAENMATFVQLNGGPGNDTLRGGTAGDALNGDVGNDVLIGRGGADGISSGAGDDLIIWNAGDGRDLVSGTTGNDLLRVTGSAANDMFSLVTDNVKAFLRHDPDVVGLQIEGIETIEIFGLGGIDTMQSVPNLAAGSDVDTLILHGGDDNDSLTGSDTADIIDGDAGVDFLDGQGGADTITPGLDDDTVRGGAGDDVIVWRAGDGRDLVEGDLDRDTLRFHGDAGNEAITIIPMAPRVVVRRDVGGSFIDVSLGTIEQIDIRAGGGDDVVTVNPAAAGLVAVNALLEDGNDTFRTIAASVATAAVADGGPGADVLIFDAQNQKLTSTQTTISVGGTVRVTHANFEQVQMAGVTVQPPTLGITSPTTEAVMMGTSPFITLRGTVTGTGLMPLTWTSSRGASGTIPVPDAPAAANWTLPNVRVYAGENIFTVTATDAAGHQAIDTLTVTVDVFSYTMAEGATGGFFDTDILIANPNATEAVATITYLRGDGFTFTETRAIAPASRITITVDSVPGFEDAEVSATVATPPSLPLIVERTMRWDSTGYGAHTERASDAPARNWFFAEGSQGFFQTYLLLANPGAAPNTATVTFLLESGAPVVRTFPLEPTSRTTIGADTIAELANQSFGIAVAFTQPGVAERAMYFGTRVFEAGHESAGVTSPSTDWFLAEGATGSFFTTFVLLANPGALDADAAVTFLPATGQSVGKRYVVPAGRRVTLNIAAEDPSLADSAVATTVTSTQPILVERAQFWPFTPDRWYEAHNSFGGTALGARWGLAEGRVGGPQGYQTYILLANASDTASAVTITFLRESGAPVTKSFVVPPTSRVNVFVNAEAPELANESFGAVVDVTSGPGIFVERALYSSAQGVVFAAGTNALATRLP